MNLRFSGKLTKEEYLAYIKLSNRPILKKDSSHIDMWVIFVSIGSFLSLVGLVVLLQGSSSNSSSFPWYLPQLIIGIIMIGLGLKFRGALSKYWEENKESLSSVNGAISDDTVEIHTPNGTLKAGWSEFNGYGETKEMIVLYQPPVFAIPFLERFFDTQEDWLAFKEYVVNNISLTHRVDQGERSKRKTAYILLSISMIVIYLYLYIKSR